MRGGALLLLPACLAVAGCGDGADTHADAGLNSEMAAKANGTLLDPEKVMAERWQSVFDPAKAVAVANEFGYRAGAYAAKDGAYGVTGTQQLLPDAKSPLTIATNFSAKGNKADRIDTIAFSFDVKQNGKVATKKERDAARIPDRIVRGFLQRFEVGPSDAVRQAVNQGTATEVELHGVTVKVAAEPLPSGKPPVDRRMTVTFTNNSEAQASS
ncbi:hypothetical protein [Sphingomonas sp. dw_22]|uniref:hypothetical protein n=1 Tax=Sphingomonas sp. dw_22 TaxID=2721175 RepID=UPI001BD45729|nr:hypothetical protein [Sphingomonas sp. dw_22]